MEVGDRVRFRAVQETDEILEGVVLLRGEEGLIAQVVHGDHAGVFSMGYDSVVEERCWDSDAKEFAPWVKTSGCDINAVGAG